PPENGLGVYAPHLGFLAGGSDGAIAGYDVLVGGGMGMSHGNARTFPHLAKPVMWIESDQVLPAGEAVIKLFRDHGNRADRKRARLKYVIHDWGVERFREVLAEYLPFAPAPPRGLRVTGVDLHLGWHPQGDGKWFYGLSIENGRVKDEGKLRLRTVLRTIIERFKPSLRITPHQDLLLCDLPAGTHGELERLLDAHCIPPSNRVTPVRQLGPACPS